MRNRVFTLLAAVLLAAMTVLAVRHGFGRMRASRLLWSVERRTGEMLARGVVSQQLVAGHLAALADAARLDPSEVAIPTARGGQYLILGDATSAIEAYKMASWIEPRPEIDLNLGKAFLAAGDLEHALRQMTTAVVLAPHLLAEVPDSVRKEVAKRRARRERSGPS